MIFLKDIIKEIIDNNGEKIIFVDMDGVLTDYFKAIEDLGADNEYDGMIMASEVGPSWWINMSWKDGGPILWKFIINNFKNIHILSSVDGPGNFTKYSMLGKYEWCKNNIPQINKDNIHLVTNGKSKFSGVGRILIDDTLYNIDGWRRGGGFGILHKNTSDTINKLRTIK